MTVDYLIIGQGLAGSAIAMALLDKNASILVLDKETPNSATRVAAGLITTVAGKGMNTSWRQQEYLAQAIAYYRRIEQQTRTQLYHPMELLKLFDDEKQRAKFDRKKDQLEEWVKPADQRDLSTWNAPHGGFLMQHGGWLDTCAYLTAVQKILGLQYQKRPFDQSLIHIENGKIHYQEITANTLILCQGAAGLTDQSNLFSHLTHRSAKGEMLTIHIPDQPQEKIINRNGWLVPIGNHHFKVGATYEWDDMSGSTTDLGRSQVEQKLKGILGNDRYQVTGHTAGVRPIIRKSQPVIISHPEHPQIKCFNGLGSKGVITAPSVGKHLADHLVEAIPLDPELTL